MMIPAGVQGPGLGLRVCGLGVGTGGLRYPGVQGLVLSFSCRLTA